MIGSKLSICEIGLNNLCNLIIHLNKENIMEDNKDNPNSNIILNLQKENICLKQRLIEVENKIASMIKQYNNDCAQARSWGYHSGYKQASRDNAVNIKLTPNLGAASGDFTLSSAQPNANGDVFPKHLPISSFAREFSELIAQEYSKMKEYK